MYVIKEILSNKDNASLLGDFAFSVMPTLATNELTKTFEMEKEQLKVLLWKLEDGILKCDPPEDFVLRFLTEKFSQITFLKSLSGEIKRLLKRLLVVSIADEPIMMWMKKKTIL